MQTFLQKAARTAQSAMPMMKPLKDTVYLHARRLLKIPHESQFRIVRRFPSIARNFVDVGANQGQSIESVLLYNKSATISAFEPNPALAEMLRSRYLANLNINIVAAGLSDESRKSVMFVPQYNGFVYDGAGSLNYNEADWLNKDRMISFDSDRYQISSITCQLETLDGFRLAPTFLKIDVQGTEHDVLVGAKETIAEHEPLILMEAPDHDCRTLLLELGYSEYGFVNGDLVEGYFDNRHANTFFVTRGRLDDMRRDAQ